MLSDWMNQILIVKRIILQWLFRNYSTVFQSLVSQCKLLGRGCLGAVCMTYRFGLYAKLASKARALPKGLR